MAEVSIAELHEDHEVIEVLARRLDAMIGTDSDAKTLSTTLGHLIQAVADHLDREDAAIYSVEMRTQLGYSDAAIAQVRDEFSRLKHDWGLYLVHWTEEQIQADRDGFARATRAVLPRLRDRVRLEDQLLVASALHRPHDGADYLMAK